MAQRSQVFNHNTPQAPVLTGGMMLGASGVSHPKHQTIGVITGASSADGSFSEAVGYGQGDYDVDGRWFQADGGNNRLQCFIKNVLTGIWDYHSKLTSVGTLLGGGVNCALVAIDRTVTPNEIHVAAWDHNAASNWISVWRVSDWPNFTTLNRVRQYGANASSDIAGRSNQGLGLVLDGTYAVVSSWGTPYRQLRWNHQTGALMNEETQSNQVARWTTDGAGNWWSASLSSAEPGLWKNNPATFTGISRLDVVAQTSTWRRNKFWNSGPTSIHYYDGRIYAKDHLGQVLAWNAVSGAYVDHFLHPGSLQASGVVTGFIGFTGNSTPLTGKSSIIVDQHGCPWYMAWGANADNSSTTQCFKLAFPMGIATATWIKTDWSAGINTLQSLQLQGLHLSGEKYEVLLRKNGGPWITFTTEDLRDSSLFEELGTFTDDDELEVQLCTSTWERLDFAPGLTATVDKLSPQNVSLKLEYDDSVADVYVPYASSTLKAKLMGKISFKSKLGA